MVAEERSNVARGEMKQNKRNKKSGTIGKRKQRKSGGGLKGE